jgi:menaquinone-dependent protoporphyrinogen oxidase
MGPDEEVHMSILVTYGTKMQGTAGLAEMVGEALRTKGPEVDVLEARQVGDLDGYEAVIVGGALYAFHWHKDARRFVKRHATELRSRPTYFFSSGPLDDSASAGEIPPVRSVRSLMDLVQARGHVTFGGCLAADAKGFPARAMAKKNAGDWRDVDRVRTWVDAISPELVGVAHH